MKRGLTKFGIILLGWTLLSLLQVSSIALYRSAIGEPAGFLSTLHFSLVDYWLWAALTPVIFLLAKQFPFTRENWARATAIHFCFYLMLTLLHEALSELVGLPAGAPASFHGSILWLRFVSSLYDDLWMYWPAVVVWSLYHYYQRYREGDLRAVELKAQLSRAQLQALRNQLHPHFLFNTLNSVASLMHEDVEAADDMLGDLSQLLRVYLSGGEGVGDEQEIHLRREMQLLDTYIRIQKRRFEGRLSAVFDVPEELLDAAIPSLLLQPLVENSILHGIAARSSPGYVRVSVRRNGSALHLEVTDNGLGMPHNYAEGIGLSNTRARVQQLYEDRQSFEITNEANGGVGVRIAIPLRLLSSSALADDAENGLHLDSKEDANPYKDFDSNAVKDCDKNSDRGRRTARPATDSVVAQNR